MLQLVLVVVLVLVLLSFRGGWITPRARKKGNNGIGRFYTCWR